MYRRVSQMLWLSLGMIVGISVAGADKSGVSPSVLVLPQGPGSLGGVGENVQANLNMGLMSYPINMQIPPGRGGDTPSVSVAYSSSAGATLMGIGWSLNAGGSVSRLTVRGLPQYTDEDRFYAGGELVPISNTPYFRARMEGDFYRYRWIRKDNADQRGYWIGEGPDGSKSYYGANAKGELDLDSQVYGLAGTFQWELRTSVDRNGNRTEYTYFKDSSRAYIDTISWVFDKNNKALYQLRFVYEDRPDVISDGKPGFDMQTLKRIKEIQITSAGQRFRSYTFAYEDATGLTRLSKVTQYGRDGKEAYPVAFSMKYSDATFSKENSRLVVMPTALGVNFANRKADLIDINGDGLPDIIDTTNSNHVFHINTLTLNDKLQQTAHDFPDSAKKTNPDATSGASLDNASVQMLDFNGDGFTDMVDAVNKVIYINKGNGQWEKGSGSLASFPVTGKDANMRFFDYNGDKAIDVISSNGTTTTYWVSDGNGNWKQVDGKPSLGANISTDNIRFIDINGDGLNDAVQILPKNMRYKKYLGYGQWSEWIDIKVPQLDKYDLNTKAQFADINGDGMADMVAFLDTSIVYFVNKNGREFSDPQVIQNFFGQDIPSSTKNSVRIADMNGNGSRDIVWIDGNGKITYLEVFSERPNLLKEIANNIGQHIHLTYGSSVYHYLRDQSAKKTWRSKMPMAFTVVNEIKTWASRDKNNPSSDKACPRIQRVYYHDGYYDGPEKQFRGFREVESVHAGDESAGCEVKSMGQRRDMLRFYVGDGDTQSGDKDLYYHGKIRERMTSGDTHDGKLITFSFTKTEWNDCKVDGSQTTFKPDIRYVCRTAQEQTIQEGESDTAKWKILRSEYEYDGYGNIVLSKTLGEKDKSGDEKYVRYTYITPTDPNYIDEKKPWFLRLLQKQEVCTAATGGECATQEYFYDGPAFQGLPAGQATHGNVTRQSAKPAANAEAVNIARKEYDGYGNVITIKDANGNLSKVEWDSEYQRFPVKNTKIMDGYELSYTTEWDIPYAVVRRSTDWNGNTNSYEYDVFGRLVQAFQPGDTSDKPSVVYEYKLQEPISMLIARTRSKTGGDQDIVKIQCFDGLGRALQQRLQTKPGNFLVMGHLAYNSASTEARSARDYESSSETCTFDLPKDVKTVDMYYDGLGRKIRTVAEDGSLARRIYQPLVTVYYDAADNDKTSPHFDTPMTEYNDGLGRLLKRVEMSKPGHLITTSYDWTFLNIANHDLITTVTDAQGNKKIQKYDLLGRITEVIDPDRKTTQFTYDNAGNVIQRKDERGVITMFTYDALLRTKTIQEKDKPDTKIEMFYDNPSSDFPNGSNLKSRLSYVTYPQGADYSSYDRRGNLTQYRRVLLGATFDFETAFDNVDRILSRKFPDGRTITYEHDGADRLTAIPGLIKHVIYSKEHGQAESWMMENGINTQLAYDVQNRPTLVNVQEGKVIESRYTYDPVGNFASIERGFDGKLEKQEYSYDALYRLTQAKLGSSETLTYRYDDIGNITEKSSSLSDKSMAHIGAYTYDANRPRAVAKAGKWTLDYDAAGHMTNDSRNQFSWDFLGRLVDAKTANRTVAKFWYGSLADRFLQQEGGLHTLYLAGDYEIREGTAVIYAQLGTSRLAAWKSTTHGNLLYEDLAPLDGDKPQPDGVITVADAWVYHAARQGIVKLELKKRAPDVDITQDLLQHRLSLLLMTAKEGEKHYYHLDHLSSTLAVTDESGTVISRKSYYPYGAIREQSGHAFSYGFMGTEYNRSTGLNYANARYLNPQLGRWISADPAFELIRGTTDEWNSYWYASNNPIRLRDSAGTSSVDFEVAMVGGGAQVAFALGAAYLAYKAAKHTQSTGARVGLGVFAAFGILGTSLSLAADALPGGGALDAAFAITGVTAQIGVGIASFVLSRQDFKEQQKLKRDNSSLDKNLKRTESKLQRTETTLSTTTDTLQHTNTDLQQTQSQLSKTKGKLQKTKGQLESRSSQLQRTTTQLTKTEIQLSDAKRRSIQKNKTMRVLRDIAGPRSGGPELSRSASSPNVTRPQRHKRRKSTQ